MPTATGIGVVDKCSPRWSTPQFSGIPGDMQFYLSNNGALMQLKQVPSKSAFPPFEHAHDLYVPMFCALCTKIFSGPAPLYYTKYEFHPTGARFKQAVDERCHPCSLLWYQFAPYEQQILNEYSESIQYEFKYRYTSPVYKHGWYIEMSFSGLPFARSTDERTPRLMLCKNNKLWHGKISMLEDSTSSERSFRFAKQKLEECLRFHDCNRNPKDDAWTPSRLICVDSWPPRLYEHAEIDSGAEYVTLSHRWTENSVKLLVGGKNSVRNVEDFKKAIPFKKLSKTFQDAILFAKRIDVRFIWIDSLCIAQDSLEDWAQESSRMGDVYKNGKCNLAASAAARGTDGLFVNRDPLFFKPCHVGPDNIYEKDPEHMSLASEPPFWGYEKTNYLLITDDHLDDFQLSSFPLQRRGWVLQERFLSPRTIHFDRQIHWECADGHTSEMFPFTFLSPVPEVVLKNQDSSWETFRRAWKFLVENYSRCGLTKKTDRLIALSGIAKEVQRSNVGNRNLGKYLAGLWEEGLELQLLWRVSDTNSATRLRDSCAPSWSWASIDGAVELKERRFFSKIIAKVVHAETMTHYNGDWVEERGKIKVHGFLTKIRFYDIPNIRLQKSKTILLEWWKKLESVLITFDDEETSITDLYHLPVEQNGWETFGLLLQLSSAANAEFLRVGYVEYTMGFQGRYPNSWQKCILGEVPHCEGLLMIQDTELGKFEITLV